MNKTLLLCFIHGFKGGESTFGEEYQFTRDLQASVARELPNIDIQVLVYPRFETRGDLGACVSRFRTWLEEKVIDIEVAANTQSPTVDPSVRTILIGHSMGGLVAAETAIGLTSEKPIYSEDGIEKQGRPSSVSSLMFPYVQGVLAFDTPYLGISPGVVAHGAEGHYQNYQAAATAISQLSGLGSLWGSNAKPSAGPAPASALALPSTETKEKAAGWGTWGKVAMYAGAAGVAAAGGAAAWRNREQITEGWGWATSHLEFVGCLARAEELRKRVAYMVRLSEELDVGFANLHTRLGRAAPAREVSMVGTVLGRDRTFCNLPTKEAGGTWMPAVNDAATSEVAAHMAMFEPEDNPGYERLTKDATYLIGKWVKTGWYDALEPAKQPDQDLEVSEEDKDVPAAREIEHYDYEV